jgi:hypothetical protein
MYVQGSGRYSSRSIAGGPRVTAGCFAPKPSQPKRRLRNRMTLVSGLDVIFRFFLDNAGRFAGVCFRIMYTTSPQSSHGSVAQNARWAANYRRSALLVYRRAFRGSRELAKSSVSYRWRRHCVRIGIRYQFATNPDDVCRRLPLPRDRAFGMLFLRKGRRVLRSIPQTAMV